MGAVSVPAPGIERFSGTQPTDRNAFFPDPEQLLLIIDRLRAALLQEGVRQPVVWASSCGTGEELYGLAIAVVEELGATAAHVRLVGSDSDEQRVEKARGGIYRTETVRDLPRQLLLRHFQILGSEHWAALPPTERPIEFYADDPVAMRDRLAMASVMVAIHRPRSGEATRTDLEAVVERLAAGGLLILTDDDAVAAHPLLEPSGVYVPGTYVKRHSRRPPVPTRERPLRVTSDSSASTLPPPASCEEVRLLLSEATVLGHHGHVEEAFNLIDEALRRDPNEPMAYLVRGQLNLAAGSIEIALEDLRRLLFLFPACRLGRYWYALALRAAQSPERALAQIHELDRQLQRADAAELLEDDVTTIAELKVELASLSSELVTQANDAGEDS